MELPANYTGEAQNTRDDLVHNLVNDLLDRVLKVQSTHRADFDNTMLEKPGHLAVSSRPSPALGALTQARAGGQPAMTPIMTGSRSSIAARPLKIPASTAQRAAHPALSRHEGVVARAAGEVDAPPEPLTEFEVEQERPLGITWVRCADGGIYAKAVKKNLADPRVQEGDKLLTVSASFGDEKWPAESYGQAMYAIRTRIGPVYMKILARGGDTDIFDVIDDDVDAGFKSERRGGNYGAGTKETQERNYRSMKEKEQMRIKQFNEALEEFKKGNYEKACIEFEEVKGKEPPNYVGDRFERVTQVFKLSSYNIACCYSKLEKEDAALEAIRATLNSGWEDYGAIRSEKNLEWIRNKEPKKFRELMDQYDEPVFNPDALNAVKDWFGGLR